MTTIAQAVEAPAITAEPVYLLLHTVECVVCERSGGLLDPVLGLVRHGEGEDAPVCLLPCYEAPPPDPATVLVDAYLGTDVVRRGRGWGPAVAREEAERMAQVALAVLRGAERAS